MSLEDSATVDATSAADLEIMMGGGGGGGGGGPESAALQRRIEELEKDRRRLEGELAASEDEVQTLQKKHTELKSGASKDEAESVESLMAAQGQISSLREQLQKAKAAGGGTGGGPSVDKAIETASKEAAVSDDDGHHAAAGVLAGEVQSLRQREAALTDLLAKSQRSMKKLRESQSEVDPESGLMKASADANASPAGREAADKEAKKRAAADRAELDTTKVNAPLMHVYISRCHPRLRRAK